MIVIELKDREIVELRTEAVLKVDDHEIQLVLRGDYELMPGIEVEIRTKPKGRNPIIRQPDEHGFVSVPKELFFGKKSGTIYVRVVSWTNYKNTVAKVEIPYIVKKEVDKEINFKELR